VGGNAAPRARWPRRPWIQEARRDSCAIVCATVILRPGWADEASRVDRRTCAAPSQELLDSAQPSRSSPNGRRGWDSNPIGPVPPIGRRLARSLRTITERFPWRATARLLLATRKRRSSGGSRGCGFGIDHRERITGPDDAEVHAVLEPAHARWTRKSRHQGPV
jgi:hypothetical protein